MQGGDEKDLLSVADTSAGACKESPVAQASRTRQPLRHSPLFVVWIALLLRLAVITFGPTYHITPRRDHFQFGWEMGRIARSIATGNGFSSPTDLPTGPSAWAPPLYPYILAGIFKLFGVYSHAAAWVILAFNSIFSALTCLTLYWIAQRMYGLTVARATAWTWALFPYAIYWPTRVVWETSLTAFLLSLALLLTLRMADQTPRQRNWIIFGLLWGVIALTNTAVLSMFPFCLLWLLYHLPRDSRRFTGVVVCVLTTILVMTPWLARNYVVFGKFVFIRDNLPLEMHMANNDRLTALWTRDEHPGNDPQAMQKFQQLGEMRFMEEKQQQVRQFIVEHPALFVRFSLERAMYFWIAPPQANIIAGYDLSFARHVGFLIPAILAFGGLWLSIRNRVRGAFLLACFLIIHPLPYYLVNPFPRYKHPIEPEMIMLAVYLLWEASRVQIHWPLFHKD